MSYVSAPTAPDTTDSEVSRVLLQKVQCPRTLMCLLKKSTALVFQHVKTAKRTGGYRMENPRILVAWALSSDRIQVGVIVFL